MLQFIFGPVFSGKTTTVLNRVKEISQIGGQAVIIVPEQASFETEKSVLRMVGDSFARNVQIYSFSRLYDEVSRKIGGLSAKVLSDSDKVIFMSKALKQVSSDLLVWGKYVNSFSFAKTMLDNIGEFKINGITAEEIKNARLLCESKTLSDKLHDLSLIYETYDLLISERFLDPADILTKLYFNLSDFDFFGGKTVFIDGFKGFTGQQYKIIDRILTQAENVYISLTNDLSSGREYDVFTNIRTAVLKLEKIAKAHNVKVSEPIVLKESHFTDKTLCNVSKILSDGTPSGNTTTSLSLCKAKTIYDEAEFAARTIRRLVRKENYRYRDFVIIARDSEKYAQAVEYACEKNGVNCFFDKKISLLSFPLSIAALSAIKALDFSSENIFRFHKSGIGVLSLEEISKLENYAYLWNINGKIWLNEWDMDVRGFVTEEPTENMLNELKEINNIREKAIKPLIIFKKNFKDNAKNMASAIVELFDYCNADTALKNICNSSNLDAFSSDALKQCYDVFMKTLDNIVLCYNEQNLKTSQFYDALNLALSTESVGVIPQEIDQVVFGQADRIRPSAPKVAFVLGANQGVFPKFSDNNSIFATKERKTLISMGFSISDNEIFASIDENFLVYCNLCCASEKLFISYSVSSLKGEQLSPSAFVFSLEEKLSPKIYIEPSPELEVENLPETKISAYSEFCRRFSEKGNLETLKSALGYSADALIDIVSEKHKSIDPQNAEALYGKDIYMSATKFDTFNRCKFSFFCKYGLRLKKLQPADFDVLQRGTIVHYVLEQIIGAYKDEIKHFSKEKCDSLCDYYIEEYLNSVIGYNTVKSARHEFLISKISRSLKEVVYHISREFAQSDFVPTHCELAIGGADGLPLSFDYDNGKVNLVGSIDRVDEFNGYIRVVDYKTGTKTFKLPDILFGLNLQMLIYLYALIRGQGKSDKNAAGILYMPSKRDLNNNGMTMNGLLKGDTDLVYAMEKENRGEYVPTLSILKDGSISKQTSTYISEDEFSLIFDHIEKLMKNVGNSISNGEINVSPTDGRESTACGYCDFKGACRLENDLAFKVPNLKNHEIFEQMRKGEEDGI